MPAPFHVTRIAAGRCAGLRRFGFLLNRAQTNPVRVNKV
jgi:hypothetical protein